MFDANQSFRINFENVVEIVHVHLRLFLQARWLYKKKQNIWKDDHHTGTFKKFTAEIKTSTPSQSSGSQAKMEEVEEK